MVIRDLPSSMADRVGVSQGIPIFDGPPSVVDAVSLSDHYALKGLSSVFSSSISIYFYFYYFGTDLENPPFIILINFPRPTFDKRLFNPDFIVSFNRDFIVLFTNAPINFKHNLY